MSDFVAVEMDEDNERPVPTEWRPYLCSIAEALRDGDYCLVGCLPGIKRLEASRAELIKDNIDEYGEALTALPEESWETSVCLWMDGYWQVAVDLFSEESGCTDLILDVRVYKENEGYRYETQLVYVP